MSSDDETFAGGGTTAGVITKKDLEKAYDRLLLHQSSSPTYMYMSLGQYKEIHCIMYGPINTWKDRVLELFLDQFEDKEVRDEYMKRQSKLYRAMHG